MNKKEAKAKRQAWAENHPTSDFVIKLKRTAAQRREQAKIDAAKRREAEIKKDERLVKEREGNFKHDPLIMLALLRILSRLR